MPNDISGGKRIEMTELVAGEALLAECDEDTQREYLLSLAHIYKVAKVGDAMFKEVCQGRAEGPASRGELFSTCGEWAMFLLERFGYRGPILNRDLFEDGKKIRAWVSGKNIEYLFSRARKEGLFSEYLLSKQKAKRPSTGDIVYIATQGDPRSEHVFMFSDLIIETDHEGLPYEIWTSVDGGQGGRKTQHIAECRRKFYPKTGKLQNLKTGEDLLTTGRGRDVIGWVNTALLPLTKSANLNSP